MVDTDKEIKISAELPGLDEKDIEISLTRDALTIKGEKREEKEEKKRLLPERALLRLFHPYHPLSPWRSMRRRSGLPSRRGCSR